MDVVELRGATFPTFNDNALFCNHPYKHVSGSRMRLAIGTDDLQILMRRVHLLPGSSCGYPRCLLALLCTRSLMNSVQFDKPLGSVFFLLLGFKLFLSFTTSRGSSRSCGRARCHYLLTPTFELLLGEKHHFTARLFHYQTAFL